MSYRLLANGRFGSNIVPCGSRGVVVGWTGHLVDTHAGTDVARTGFRITAASYAECSAVLDAPLAAEIMAKSTRVWMQR